MADVVKPARPPQADRCRQGSLVTGRARYVGFRLLVRRYRALGPWRHSTSGQPGSAGAAGQGTQQGECRGHLILGQSIDEVLELLPLRAHVNQCRWGKMAPSPGDPSLSGGGGDVLLGLGGGGG